MSAMYSGNETAVALCKHIQAEINRGLRYSSGDPARAALSSILDNSVEPLRGVLAMQYFDCCRLSRLMSLASDMNVS
jgi:hypothetical protein